MTYTAFIFVEYPLPIVGVRTDKIMQILQNGLYQAYQLQTAKLSLQCGAGKTAPGKVTRT